ncbi:hypothetical protein [Peribacillus butanolivorans]|nr:hypothetical protein [Peribacillus butanolivorans]QNU04338.1 hypothetical protein GM240_10550 [Peribacillus butanolivorans]
MNEFIWGIFRETGNLIYLLALKRNLNMRGDTAWIFLFLVVKVRVVKMKI